MDYRPQPDNTRSDLDHLTVHAHHCHVSIGLGRYALQLRRPVTDVSR
jgi:hypothetical protein